MHADIQRMSLHRGRVFEEHQGEHWVASHFDHRGLRIGMGSSVGANRYDPKGNLAECGDRSPRYPLVPLGDEP